MTAPALSYIHRLEEARKDYALAVAQIVDDAQVVGIPSSIILAEASIAAWARDIAKRQTVGSIYFAKVEDLDVVKIGFSTNVADRMRALRGEHRRGFEVLGTVKGTMADERWFHGMLSWCRDRTLRGNEFFSYTTIRGLIRIFLGVADTFPFNQEQKDATAVWVHRVREAGAKTAPTPQQAMTKIGAYFEKTANETSKAPT